jgi:putative ABC transport system permease protein
MQPVRKEIAAIDKNLPLFGVQTMADQISSTLWQQRMAAGLIGILGLLALLMAAVGIYGVVAQLAAQRTREIAIRMALGAEPIQVFKLIASQGAMLALMGIGAGLAAALAGTRVLSSLLWGVSATDPAVFVGASLLLAIVPFLASLAPARRASRINPVTALRQQ